jgi:hypothetical protein
MLAAVPTTNWTHRRITVSTSTPSLLSNRSTCFTPLFGVMFATRA